MGTRPALGLLLLATLLLQVSLAEDLYWEGEEDASNEFLEVKEDSNVAEHLKRFKRAWWDIFSPSSTTTPAPENEIDTEDPGDTFDTFKDDDETSEGSGSSPPERPRIEPETPGEKTLRVTFVVVQPYQEEYSNRDSPQFQQFSKTLAQAVNVLFDNLPGTQRASLIRIQSRPTDNFSCKVTLDVVTTGFDDTARIKDTLRDHIREYRTLGNVAVKDEDFSANEVNPGSAFETCAADQIQCEDGSCIAGQYRCDGIPHCGDGSDELGCPVDESSGSNQQVSNDVCPERIPCASSSVTICSDKRCNGIPDCPSGDDEDNCGGAAQGPDRGDQSLSTSPQPVEETTAVPGTTPTAAPPELTCLPGEFRCDENSRCILKNNLCDGRNDCFDGTDELNCPSKC